MPRVAETPAGMLNSVGLKAGVDKFIKDNCPMEQDTVTIVNVAGSIPSITLKFAKLEDMTTPAIELILVVLMRQRDV